MKVLYRFLKSLFQAVVIAGIVWIAPVCAQEISFDQMEQCGELICYPTLKDPDVFYYLPDQPRLAVKDGKPQFSFLKYARVSETGEAGTGRAEGGGIVHFLVTYGVGDARVRAAEAALQKIHENARIAGPIVYRTGSFALVTSFTEGADTLTRTVAVGKAPLMAGQKAAVSIAVTREGAELLWESFQSDTPDISIVFDMEFAGIREPYEATLEADWSRISKHHRLQVGGRYAWFGVDVDMLFQELRQTGAVKITTKGEQENLDKIIQSAHNKLLSVMFDPAPDELSRMASEKGNYDNLNQAIKMLKGDSGGGKGKKESRRMPAPDYRKPMQSFQLALGRLLAGPSVAHASKMTADEAYEKGGAAYQNDNYEEALEWLRKALDLNDETGQGQRGALLFATGQCLKKMDRCEEAIGYYNQALALQETEERKGMSYLYLGICLQAMGRDREALAALKAAIARLDEQGKYGIRGRQQIEAVSSKMYNEARRLDKTAISSGYKLDPSKQALLAYEDYRDYAEPAGQRAAEVAGRIRVLKNRLRELLGVETDFLVIARDPGEKKQVEKPVAGATGTQQGGKSADAGTDKEAAEASGKNGKEKDLKQQAAEKVAGKAKSSGKDKEKKPEEKKASPDEAQKKDTPGFSLVASYQMKHIKRSGKMVYQMNHYRTETQAFVMTENIGSLYRRYRNNPRVFRAVNIDDPVFKQREILVTLDGQDADTFTRHLNFVTVQMKKRHQSGDITTDEVVITPDRFNQDGNAFILSYGWKNDDDRSAWLNYNIETLWSFHGGMEIRSPASVYDSPMVALQPPHRYRTVTIEGEGAALSSAQVRHAVVTFTSYVGGEPIVTEVTIRNHGPASSRMIAIPEDRQRPHLEVEITWYLRGGRKVTSPATMLEGDIVYWDELPEKEA